jgi:hypothetical protein
MAEQIRRVLRGSGLAGRAGSARRAELSLRVGAQDEAFLRNLFGLTPDSRRAPWLPDRLVVDAHVPLSAPGLAGIARAAGRPYLIDPETYFLQDSQHPSVPWGRVPFGNPHEVTAFKWADEGFRTTLVKSVIDYQLDHDATMLIPPYLHLDTPDDPLVGIQADLLRKSADYLRTRDIHVPVLVVVALGWRCLHPTQGVPALEEVWAATAALGPAEVALAASRVHLGKSAPDRIAEFLMLIRSLSSTYKATAWQQGLLGELAVVEGAAGYETGLGRREQCDLQNRKTQYRQPRGDSVTPRAIYLDAVARSVPKRRLEVAARNGRLWRRLICTDPDCCAPGGADLLGDARRHTLITRVKRLAALEAMDNTRWQWADIADRAAAGINLGEQINGLVPRSAATPGVELGALVAIHEVAEVRRHRPGRTRRTA